MADERKSGFLAFWTTLPGVLTGLAALITAIIGAVGLWKSQSDGSNAPTTAAATTVESTSSGGGAAVSERGRLSLGSGDVADLEQGQIGTSSTGDLIFGPSPPRPFTRPARPSWRRRRAGLRWPAALARSRRGTTASSWCRRPRSTACASQRSRATSQECGS